MTALLDAGRRVVGLVLVALVVLPAWLVLDPDDFAQRMARSAAEQYWRFSWGARFGLWTLLAVGIALSLSLATRGRLADAAGRIAEAMARPPRWLAAALAGAVGAGLAAWTVFEVLEGRTVLNDASVQLIQARYFAAGHLAGPPLGLPEFWSIQFMVHTAAGWVSQYPPTHALVLAAGFALGGPWIAAMAAMGALGVLLVLSFERLLPERIALARLAALLAVTSPMLLVLAAGHMNHATVAALAAAALYCALRAERGSWVWAVAAGAAVGGMVSSRPVSGMVIGFVLTAGVWIGSERWGAADGGRAWLVRTFGGWAAGGLPFAVAWGWFNARFFGSPLTLGYVAASGPNHGLGFHEDPWGRLYGPTDALGYTSAELAALGPELLGVPFPIVALVGVFLLAAPRLERGVRILLAWAALPIVGNALYWHHDLVFGPRMLGGAGPAWCALGLLAAVWLAKAARRVRLGDAVLLLLLAAWGYAAVEGIPDRLGRHAPRPAVVPEVPVEGPSLVFVHEPWADRVGGRLSGRGLRLDSVRTLLTRYHPCQLEAAVRGAELAEVSDICRREEASDRRGYGGVTGLLWLGDLPGLPPEGPMWVRDLGPERNARLLEAYPDRVPLFVLPTGPSGEGEVVPYEEGVAELWGDGPPP